MHMQELELVFQDVFDDDTIRISETTTAQDIEEWDSVMHVNLILAVEEKFSVRFSSSEVSGLLSVGDLHDLLEKKKRNGV